MWDGLAILDGACIERSIVATQSPAVVFLGDEV